MTYTLQFSFSPVQEFVAEARKTVDLRTGSFLISYLSVCAARAVIEQAREDGDTDAAIRLFPDITQDPIYLRLTGQSQANPDTGSFPNQFSLSVPNEQTGQKWAKAAQDELQEAWEKIASRAWQQLETWYQQEMDAAVKARWDQQVESTWSIFWVVSEGGISGQMNSRKHLRAFMGTQDSGDNCTVCGHRGEISGNQNRKARNQFWQTLRNGPLGNRGFLDEKERLCAVCMTKRLLADRTISKDAIGWPLEREFPSTPRVAAEPWRQRVLADQGTREKVDDYSCEVIGKNFDKLGPGSDFDYFYESYLEELPRTAKDPESARQKLRSLYEAVGMPGNTVAVLAMDGDRLGERLSKIGDNKALLDQLSRAILEFSQEVRNIINGVEGAALVYAGGEDVLVLLPINKALETVQEIRKAYKDKTKEISELTNSEFTISGGLLFAPMNLPLRTMIRTAHMLEDVAKDEAGRNALAISVWRGGGEILRLARKWSDDKGSATMDKLLGLMDMIDDYPSRFLYQAFELLNTMQSENSSLDRKVIRKLLAVELWGSREKRFKIDSVQDAENKLAPLLEAAVHNGKLDPNVFRLLRFFQEELIGSPVREGVNVNG